MARKPRIEFAGAVYHIISRGDRGEAIYEGDEDRERFLGGGQKGSGLAITQ
jgi:hypothetical protein